MEFIKEKARLQLTTRYVRAPYMQDGNGQLRNYIYVSGGNTDSIVVHTICENGVCLYGFDGCKTLLSVTKFLEKDAVAGVVHDKSISAYIAKDAMLYPDRLVIRGILSYYSYEPRKVAKCWEHDYTLTVYDKDFKSIEGVYGIEVHSGEIILLEG